jgi:cell division protein FtsI (penicillin-binding protein 3)
MNKETLKKEDEKKDSSLTIRAFIIYLCVVLVSVGIFYRIIDLQFFHKNDLKSQSEAAKKTSETVVIPVERGTIFSRNNEILVQRIIKYKIAMDTYPTERIKGEKGEPDSIKVLLSDSVFYANVVALGDSLTEVFGATTPTWEQKLRTARENKKRYFTISANAGIKELMRVQKFPILCEQRKYNALCKPEEDLDYAKYPYGDLARRTLGEVRIHVTSSKDTLQKKQDNIERVLVGIEGYFDKELSGTNGLVLRKYISNVAIDLESEDNIEPRNGYDITTTLDMTIQDIANRSLLNNLHKYEADEGCVIVMEVATGDVLAMVNVSKDKSGTYREIENIALTQYEPGSTFKTASLLVALNDEKVTPNTPIPLSYTSGVVAKIGHRNVTDDHAIRVNNPEVW